MSDELIPEGFYAMKAWKTLRSWKTVDEMLKISDETKYTLQSNCTASIPSQNSVLTNC